MSMIDGKTVGELGLECTIMEMMTQRALIVGPNNEISDGAWFDGDETTMTLTTICSEFPGGTSTIAIPMENIGKGTVFGKSIFLTDELGEEIQISILPDETIDIGEVAERIPHGLENAIEERKKDDRLCLWEARIGVIFVDEDPTTPFSSEVVIVAARTVHDAKEKAQKYADEYFESYSTVKFQVVGSPAQTTASKFVNEM